MTATLNLQISPQPDIRSGNQTNVDARSVLDLVMKLCRALAIEQIDYCHWKSNTFLCRSLQGENDLDLLISRAHAQRFEEILYSLGFKETLLPKNEELPGVRDYYGYDRPSGRLVHVHAHFQLILGNDLSKNYRLPIERVYLVSSAQENFLRVPAPEFELLVLVMRMVLKHATWDSILMRHGSLSDSERGELEDLSTRETLAKVDAVLPHLPGLERDLFDLCLRSLQPGCPLWTRIRAGERLQKVLRSCARYPQSVDIFLKFTRRIWEPIQRRVLKVKPGNRFANGGLFVAIVGGDGAGKTTMVDEIHRWLGGKFETRRLHMGKPAWSRTTMLMRGILKVGTLLRLYNFEGDIYEEALQPHGLPWFIRAVYTARDRYLTYSEARRFSSSGGLVLCDRYSLAGFMNMDGPQCEGALTRLKMPNGLFRLLAKLEAAYYRKIAMPDLLIVLKVNPEVAVQRKSEESEASVRARSSEVWGLGWEKLSAFEVDANRSKEETLAQVKAFVWENL